MDQERGAASFPITTRCDQHRHRRRRRRHLHGRCPTTKARATFLPRKMNMTQSFTQCSSILLLLPSFPSFLRTSYFFGPASNLRAGLEFMSHARFRSGCWVIIKYILSTKQNTYCKSFNDNFQNISGKRVFEKSPCTVFLVCRGSGERNHDCVETGNDLSREFCFTWENGSLKEWKPMQRHGVKRLFGC